jgi:RHH-type proline utilization regulon transcriptional repressor/proline dehydrogenase/delta 1-pyrroline-5-carboxylate dehydrogenase
LERALKELEPGESWAVMPQLHVDGNPQLVSPGVKWGVQPNSVTHCTEFFGPVLGVMAAKNLDEAIDLVNATGYGLTSGLESLDDREHGIWHESIRAGNLYINRPTTGAIVLRQQFGGMGKSAFGPGIKAGGPNYVIPLMKLSDAKNESGVRGQESEVPIASPTWEGPGKGVNIVRGSITSPSSPLHQRDGRGGEDLTVLRDALLKQGAGSDFAAQDVARVIRAIENYRHWMTEEFQPVHDHFRLIGEDNFRRYLPVSHLRLRVHAEDSPFEIFARAAAARAAGSRTVVSAPQDLPGPARDAIERLDELTDSWAAAIEFLEETDQQLAEAMRSGVTRRVRYADSTRVPQLIREASAESYVYVADAPVLEHGRIELLWYLQEQSLSHIYHRYGNLGRRAAEPRAPAT